MSQSTWPDGKRCVVLLTFDCDFETIHLAQDAGNIKRGGTLSQGTFEAKVGLPNVLQLLQSEGVPGTFFVPGWVADNRPEAIEAIAGGAHEIGHHSYSHRFIDPTNPALEQEEIDRGIEAIKRIVGDDLVGFRAAFGEISANMLRLLSERGFLYDSSLMDDVRPYRHANGLVELPWWRHVADAPYMVPPRPIEPNEKILSIWKTEFDAAYEGSGFFDMLLHPQVIGRPGRIRLLREFIQYAQGRDGVWFATCRDVAKAWVAANPDAKPPKYTSFLREENGRILQA